MVSSQIDADEQKLKCVYMYIWNVDINLPLWPLWITGKFRKPTGYVFFHYLARLFNFRSPKNISLKKILNQVSLNRALHTTVAHCAWLSMCFWEPGKTLVGLWSQTSAHVPSRTFERGGQKHLGRENGRCHGPNLVQTIRYLLRWLQSFRGAYVCQHD